MKPSQRQPQTVDPDRSLTGTSSASLAKGISTILDLSNTSPSTADISTLVDATDVSHEIATSYHALTVSALKKNDSFHHSLHRNAADSEGDHAKHAIGTSPSFKKLYLGIPPHLRTNATQSSVGITPMEYFEEHPLPQYQQLKNYQPLDVQANYDTFRTPGYHPSDDAYSVAANIGDQENRDGGLTSVMSSRQQHAHRRSHDRDLSGWGEDLSGVGTQFDAQIRGCNPL
ncbi:hypothetical protein VTL71DRAFT_9332 [Oculimacula yallundae]|uniref:Uncharacterized protein n=1 Tax=Oculimacula yallundae TaxID=86028 RepID=A0ABR4BUA6_9HELO